MGADTVDIALTLLLLLLLLTPHKLFITPRNLKCFGNNNSNNKKKAHYRFDSGLLNACKACLVGPAGVEPTTNGLKVRCSTN